MSRNPQKTKAAGGGPPDGSVLFPASIEGVILLAVTAATKGDPSLSSHLLQWGESKGLLKPPKNVIPPDLLNMLKVITGRPG